ncbi:hypothetical protein [Nesterenkonia sp. NBAIMH1]|uniref:hypothetical protein n=1 Tax=Nesterenkonia sp. NBAIMH1 TaxID=2600320 RepID=UPI001FEF0B42|nr:hypothetical protein [Nesterenkonia sp. NBAIMH1]
MAATQQSKTSKAQNAGSIQSAAELQGLAGVAQRLKAGSRDGFGVFHMGSFAMLGAGFMLLIATFSPWVYVTLTQDIIGEAFVLRGTDGPGIVTICMGVLALAGGFFPRRRLAIAHALIAGGLTGLVVGWQVWNILSASAATAWGSFLPGMGLVLSAGAVALLLHAAVRMIRGWEKPAQKAVA